MNTPDIILLLLIFIPGIITGLKKGFIHQVITIAVIWLGALISYQFAKPVGTHLGEIVKLPDNVAYVVAFILIFLLMYSILALLGMVLRKIVRDLIGGSADRLLGILFGLFKQALVTGLLVLVFDTVNSLIPLVDKEALDASGVYCWLNGFAHTVFPFLKNLVNGMAA